MYCPCFWIVRAKNQPPNAGVHHRSRAHCTRLNCNKQLAVTQAMIAECRPRFTQRYYLGVSGWIGVFDIPIKAASNHLTLMNDNCPDRNFTRFECPLRQAQGFLHPELIGT